MLKKIKIYCIREMGAQKPNQTQPTKLNYSKDFLLFRISLDPELLALLSMRPRPLDTKLLLLFFSSSFPSSVASVESVCQNCIDFLRRFLKFDHHRMILIQNKS